MRDFQDYLLEMSTELRYCAKLFVNIALNSSTSSFWSFWCIIEEVAAFCASHLTCCAFIHDCQRDKCYFLYTLLVWYVRDHFKCWWIPIFHENSSVSMKLVQNGAARTNPWDNCESFNTLESLSLIGCILFICGPMMLLKNVLSGLSRQNLGSRAIFFRAFGDLYFFIVVITLLTCIPSIFHDSLQLASLFVVFFSFFSLSPLNKINGMIVVNFHAHILIVRV